MLELTVKSVSSNKFKNKFSPLSLTCSGPSDSCGRGGGGADGCEDDGGGCGGGTTLSKMTVGRARLSPLLVLVLVTLVNASAEDLARVPDRHRFAAPGAAAAAVVDVEARVVMAQEGTVERTVSNELSGRIKSNKRLAK